LREQRFTLCLEVLDVDSETDESGPSNSFNLAGAGVFLGEDLGLIANAGSSRGEISEQDGCQTATGESTVGFVEVPFFALTAGSSESESMACDDGTSTQEN
jgi:hypothetical protein